VYDKTTEGAPNPDEFIVGYADGMTPLCTAAQTGHEAIVRTLVAAGADKSKASAKFGTPLMSAENRGDATIVALLR
jgi:ankyrin repeat protein